MLRKSEIVLSHQGFTEDGEVRFALSHDPEAGEPPGEIDVLLSMRCWEDMHKPSEMFVTVVPDRWD